MPPCCKPVSVFSQGREVERFYGSKAAISAAEEVARRYALDTGCRASVIDDRTDSILVLFMEDGQESRNADPTAIYSAK